MSQGPRTLSKPEEARIAADKANKLFREFQAAKHNGAGDVPVRKERAVEAAKKSADLWHAVQETSDHLSPDGASKLSEKVYAADCLLKQAKETKFGVALTATDDVVTASGRAKDAKGRLEKLERTPAPDPSELKQARAEVGRTESELNIALQRNVDSWREALNEAKAANDNGGKATIVRLRENALHQAQAVQKILTSRSGR